jgi:chaperonin cofactor prefoldin
MTSIGTDCYGVTVNCNEINVTSNRDGGRERGTINCNEINVKEKINGYKISELVERMETLEKTNKTLTQNLEKVNERVNESKVLEETLNKKIEDLEASVSFLKNRNTILERNCVIDNSKYAFLIQRYWKKYVLIKRIKEAAKIYKFTRNFSRFVKPVELMEDLIDCRSVVGDPPKPSVEIDIGLLHVNHVPDPVTVGRRHRGPASVTSESSIKRSEQIVRDWNN